MKPRCTTPIYELLKGAEKSVHTQAFKTNTNDDADFQIARDGTWFYHGSPILRKSLVKLFATVLTRQSDGTFWLVTPVERVKVSVQSTPFIAITATKGRDDFIFSKFRKPILFKIMPRDTGIITILKILNII